MRQILFIPCKPFKHAKSRLATVLESHQRAALALALYMHTLDVLVDSVLAGTGGAVEPIVISSDAQALALARQAGLGTFAEQHVTGLNAALSTAMEWVGRHQDLRYAYLPIDLWQLQPTDVDALFGRAQEGVLISPDLSSQGTNFLSWPSVLPLVPAFGGASFVAHGRQAIRHRSPLQLCDIPALRRDLDLPSDLPSQSVATAFRLTPSTRRTKQGSHAASCLP